MKREFTKLEMRLSQILGFITGFFIVRIIILIL